MATNHTTILFVDDDPDDREMFFYAINKLPSTLNVEVMTFAGCNQLMAYLDMITQIETTIIFLDINMPQLSGIECLKELRETEKFKQVPAVIYTTSTSEKDIREARELGADMYIKKPTTIDDLIRLIKEVVGKFNNGRHGDFTLAGV